MELWGRDVLLLQASSAEQDTKLGLIQFYLRSRSLVFILRSWKADGYCLLHPAFQAKLLCFPAHHTLKPSFARLMTGTTSQRRLQPTALLHNNTTACFPLASARPLVLGRGKVVGKFFPRAPSSFRLRTMLGREDGEKIDRDDGVWAYPSSSSA